MSDLKRLHSISYADLDAKIQADKRRFREKFPDLAISEEEEAYRLQFIGSEDSGTSPLGADAPGLSSTYVEKTVNTNQSLSDDEYNTERERIGLCGYLMSIKEAAWFYGYEYSSMRIYIHKGLIETIGDTYHGKRIAHSAMQKFVRTRKPTGRRPYGANAESLKSISKP